MVKRIRSSKNFTLKNFVQPWLEWHVKHVMHTLVYCISSLLSVIGPVLWFSWCDSVVVFFHFVYTVMWLSSMYVLYCNHYIHASHLMFPSCTSAHSWSCRFQIKCFFLFYTNIVVQCVVCVSITISDGQKYPQPQNSAYICTNTPFTFCTGGGGNIITEVRTSSPGSSWEDGRAQRKLGVMVFSFLCRYIRQMHHSSASCQVWQHLELRFPTFMHLEWTLALSDFTSVECCDEKIQNKKRFVVYASCFMSFLWITEVHFPLPVLRDWLELTSHGTLIILNTCPFFFFLFLGNRQPLM